MRRKRAVSPVVAVVLLVAIVVIAVAAVAYIVLNLGAGEGELTIISCEWTDTNDDRVNDELALELWNEGTDETEVSLKVFIQNGGADEDKVECTLETDSVKIKSNKRVDLITDFTLPGATYPDDFVNKVQIYSWELTYNDGDRTDKSGSGNNTYTEFSVGPMNLDPSSSLLSVPSCVTSGSSGARRTNLLCDGNNDTYDGGSGYAYTRWTAAGNYMQIDLGAEYTITAIYTLLWDGNDRYYLFRIAGSNDGGAGTNIIDRTDTSLRPKSWQLDTLDTPVSYRYIRIYGTYHSANSGFHIVEMEIYGYSP